jgi:hypothetical protein
MADAERDVDRRVDERPVVLVDVRMPFWGVVGLMVKFAVASIPAAIIVTLLGYLAVAVLRGLFTGLSLHR